MAPPQVNDEYRNQIKKASEELDKLLSKNKHYAPLMLRLALHDAGIYGPYIGTEYYFIKRGPNGSIGKPKELEHPSNEGLDKVVAVCDGVKNDNKCEKITYADLYQLAGIAALKITGGPKIEFVPGREDSMQDPEQGGPLKDKKLDESVLEKITKRMGLEEKHMVALVGGLCQWDLPVKSAGEDKNSDDKKTQESYQFDNSYFKDLQKREADNPLIKGEGFHKWVDKYAQSKEAFLTDYVVAHKKVSELGMNAATSSGKGDPQTDKKSSATGTGNRAKLVQRIGIAVVTTAIIIGFFLSRRSK